jgi:hypothetical protein
MLTLPTALERTRVMLVPEVCATLRFSTVGMPEPARAQAVRDFHLHERTFLSAKLEPTERLPDYPLHVDLTKRTLPGLAVVSGTLCGLRHAIRPSGAAPNGGDDLLLAVDVRGAAWRVIWDLSVKKIDGKTCEFTNMVHSSATPELMDFLGKQGIPWEVFQADRKPVSEGQETPLFAKEYRTARLKGQVSLLVDARIQQI